jgi:hypothetical protein
MFGMQGFGPIWQPAIGAVCPIWHAGIWSYLAANNRALVPVMLGVQGPGATGTLARILLPTVAALTHCIACPGCSVAAEFYGVGVSIWVVLCRFHQRCVAPLAAGGPAGARFPNRAAPLDCVHALFWLRFRCRSQARAGRPGRVGGGRQRPDGADGQACCRCQRQGQQ